MIGMSSVSVIKVKMHCESMVRFTISPAQTRKLLNSPCRQCLLHCTIRNRTTASTRTGGSAFFLCLRWPEILAPVHINNFLFHVSLPPAGDYRLFSRLCVIGHRRLVALLTMSVAARRHTAQWLFARYSATSRRVSATSLIVCMSCGRTKPRSVLPEGRQVWQQSGGIIFPHSVHCNGISVSSFWQTLKAGVRCVEVFDWVVEVWPPFDVLGVIFRLATHRTKDSTRTKRRRVFLRLRWSEIFASVHIFNHSFTFITHSSS